MYDSIIEFGLDASRWLQATYPQIAPVMEVISGFGQFEFYLLVLPFVYWSLNKRFGLHLAYMVIFAAAFNGIIKHFLRQPRPFWLDSSLSAEGTSGYGLPSGHVQITTTVSFLIAGWFRRGWLWVFAIVYTLLMVLSRIYLGQHFVHDTVLGLLLGGLTLAGYAAWRQFLHDRFKQRIFGQRLLIAIFVPASVYALYIGVIYLMGEPAFEFALRELGEAAELSSFEDNLGYMTVLLAAGAGFTFEKSRVCFQSDGDFWKRIARYLVGIVITLALYIGGSLLSDAINPSELLVLDFPIRFVRYAVLGVWISYYAPMLFVALGLANRQVEPEIPYSVGATVLPTRKEK